MSANKCYSLQVYVLIFIVKFSCFRYYIYIFVLNTFILEHLVGPCLWVGTSLGNVVLFAASFPPAGEQRQTQPVLTFNTGNRKICIHFYTIPY